MQLGELAWKIEFQTEEKERIASLLGSKEHLARAIFKKYGQKTKGFKRGSKSLHSKIKGFRPGSPAYNARAIDHMLADLSRNKAPNFFWNIYREAVTFFVEEDLPPLHSMMVSAEVKVEDNLTNSEHSSFFIRSICENASDYDVYDSDVELVYELWPVERLDNYEALLASCPKFDRVKMLEGVLFELSDDFGKLKDELADFAGKSVTKFISKAHLEDSIRKSENRNHKTTGQLIRNEIHQVETKIHSSVKNLQEKLGKIQIAYTSIKSKIDLIERDIKGLKSLSKQNSTQISHVESSLAPALQGLDESLVSQLDEIKSSVSEIKNISEEHEKKICSSQIDFQTSNSKTTPLDVPVLNTAGCTAKPSNFSDVPEDRFVSEFMTCCYRRGLDYSQDLIRLFHCIFKSSAVVHTSNTELISAWIETLGWESLVMRIAASPTWNDPADWSDARNYIFSADSMPKVVYILDYDIGLVEAYLNPTLRLWMESTLPCTVSKLFLVPSPDLSEPLGLRAPVSFLDDLQEGVVRASKRLNPRKEKYSNFSVSLSSVESWITDLSRLSEELEKGEIVKSSKDIYSAVDSCGIMLERPMKLAILQFCSGLEKHGFSPTESAWVCSVSVVLPWVKSNLGAAKSSELRAYVSS